MYNVGGNFVDSVPCFNVDKDLEDSFHPWITQNLSHKLGTKDTITANKESDLSEIVRSFVAQPAELVDDQESAGTPQLQAGTDDTVLAKKWPLVKTFK